MAGRDQQQRVLYSLVARGQVVLAEHSSVTGNANVIANVRLWVIVSASTATLIYFIVALVCGFTLQHC
ncbi:hypothetical protein TSOC_006464 [Tetrabaena socialis]|uniref:Uncharacterized protein n=1 Tax=Tetrabaena socialis TaxID=47790 RepID=A0A2J8A3K3_9CHLO|nr:hypothetical protein TSOC_006464 [Tetrabaena socialis]|eukprot:PNH07100.1 hypothetical protein TSOC_006464 [Tetrabaena socialis]